MREIVYNHDKERGFYYTMDKSISVPIVAVDKTLQHSVGALFHELDKRLRLVENVLNLVDEEETEDLHYLLYEELYKESLDDEFKVLKSLHNYRTELLCTSRDIHTNSYKLVEVGENGSEE